MKTSQAEIGARLRQIRNIFDDGYKMLTPKFAEKIGESKFNIQNYERGLASIPNRVLIALYEYGFNPSYILTGEGSMYADNPAGKKRQLKSEGKIEEPTVKIISAVEFSGMTIDEIINHPAAAGNLLILRDSKESENK